MSVWEIVNDRINEVAGVVIPAAEQDNLRWWDKFGGDGSALKWRSRPKLELLVGRGRKKPKPRADLSPFMPGALVMSVRARDALGSVLAPFGQLLELSVEGQPEYFYNVTNVLACIDANLSERRPEGTIAREVFDMGLVPSLATVFKDRLNLGKIYVNSAGKSVLEQLVAEHKITGLSFRQAGHG
ncbi:hypothetical protein PY254_14170 [Rhodanobacter sp. AS-Z3]|uniref:hypothetical protein n=1 Tax=Rhodanobacter sp. AS-Z3 TaxID=3031330 RepID=UPI00247A75D7|nr:hypothetical protein [Rhodanobacter sp. AS-Z3]WEN14369.1 hypothetical protein PY254_14170 [Rhodanobacter sp. AS-Z3]